MNNDIGDFYFGGHGVDIHSRVLGLRRKWIWFFVHKNAKEKYEQRAITKYYAFFLTVLIGVYNAGISSKAIWRSKNPDLSFCFGVDSIHFFKDICMLNLLFDYFQVFYISSTSKSM